MTAYSLACRSLMTLTLCATTQLAAQINNTMAIAKEHAGVFRFGVGTPGCLGMHAVDIDGPVVVGGATAILTVTNNNPNGIGLWLFGTSVNGNYGTLPLPGPTELYIDALGTWFVTELYVADLTVVGSFALQAPSDPSLRTLRLDVQPIGLWLGPCNAGLLTFSSSQALGLQIQ